GDALALLHELQRGPEPAVVDDGVPGHGAGVGTTRLLVALGERLDVLAEGAELHDRLVVALLGERGDTGVELPVQLLDTVANLVEVRLGDFRSHVGYLLRVVVSSADRADLGPIVRGNRYEGSLSNPDLRPDDLLVLLVHAVLDRLEADGEPVDDPVLQQRVRLVAARGLGDAGGDLPPGVGVAVGDDLADRLLVAPPQLSVVAVDDSAALEALRVPAADVGVLVPRHRDAGELALLGVDGTDLELAGLDLLHLAQIERHDSSWFGTGAAGFGRVMVGRPSILRTSSGSIQPPVIARPCAS